MPSRRRHSYTGGSSPATASSSYSTSTLPDRSPAPSSTTDRPPPNSLARWISGIFINCFTPPDSVSSKSFNDSGTYLSSVLLFDHKILPFCFLKLNVSFSQQNMTSVVDGAQRGVCRDITMVTAMKRRTRIKDSASRKSTRPPRTSPHPSGSDKEVSALFTRSNSEMAPPLLSNVPKRSFALSLSLFCSLSLSLCLMGMFYLEQSLHKDDRQGTEFMSEIKTLAQVTHLSLVKYYGYLVHNDEKLLVVEYVPNGNLRDHLDC